jgi:hypothetical protein
MAFRPGGFSPSMIPGFLLLARFPEWLSIFPGKGQNAGKIVKFCFQSSPASN